MRVFITGACGFVGRHLVRELEAAGHQPFGFGLEPSPGPDFCPVVQGDILNPQAVADAVMRVRPDAGIHLAAMASPTEATTRSALMAAVNVQGTVHVLEAFRRGAPLARLLVISSARVYGSRNPDVPIREDDPLTPDSLYAITKEAADRITLQYAADFNSPFMTARPHNHTGPGQGEAFIVGSFAAQFRRMAAGKTAPLLKIGNPDSSRDFLDVRDVVRAYRLLLEQGKPGLSYNIASGRHVTIRMIIDTLGLITGVKPEVLIEPARFRPSDFSALLDTTRLAEHTGWRPALTLEQTLRDMVAV
jgi:GDP-4-dehydro-6-deoxy-D-mannose reductase